MAVPAINQPEREDSNTRGDSHGVRTVDRVGTAMNMGTTTCEDNQERGVAGRGALPGFAGETTLLSSQASFLSSLKKPCGDRKMDQFTREDHPSVLTVLTVPTKNIYICIESLKERERAYIYIFRPQCVSIWCSICFFVGTVGTVAAAAREQWRQRRGHRGASA